MLDLTEASKILDRVVDLHKDKDHIDIMLVAVGELHRTFGGKLIKTDVHAYRRNFDMMEVVFSFQKPFETELDDDGDPLAPTQEQLRAHSMNVSFKFGSGNEGDWIGGCRMMDIFIRNNGILHHKHIGKNRAIQQWSKDVFDWAFKIDYAQKELDKERSLA